MSLTQSHYGTTPDGKPVSLFTFQNADITIKLTDFGGHLLEIITPDRKGSPANINLAYTSLDPLFSRNPYFGATVGRVANRIANAKFSLNGTEYTLPANNGPNTLHGGTIGFDKHLWTAAPRRSEIAGSSDSLTLSLTSPDADQGFPGTVQTSITYTLDSAGLFRIDYQAITDQPTPVNLTHHPYFNLAGAGNGTILNHLLTIHADAYTPVSDTLIPTGEIKPVHNTPFDFTTPHRIGERLANVPGGYDHNFCLYAKPNSSSLSPAALVLEETTGRHMEISTNQPGIQFYSGNFLDGSITGLGGPYLKHGGFCLETQKFPDALHHPHFPSFLLLPGQTYNYSTTYRFFAK
ncbi:MAG TPA: aldose epimerase family protein [Tepidisphaeraceae bacterium]|nr:aldose epimerase family protein [Tepidisphaeraceae bacterium]